MNHSFALSTNKNSKNIRVYHALPAIHAEHCIFSIITNPTQLSTLHALPTCMYVRLAIFFPGGVKKKKGVFLLAFRMRCR